MKVRHVERVVEPVGRAAQPDALVERVERAAFDISADLRRTRAGLRRDGDDAADRVGAVKPALRSAQDFDLLNVRRQKVPEIDRPARRAGIGDVDSIDQNLDVIGIGAANEHRRLTAGRAVLHDLDARHGHQNVRDRAALHPRDIGGGDDGHRTRDVIRRRRHGRRADDGDFRQIHSRLRVSGGRSGEQKYRTQQSPGQHQPTLLRLRDACCARTGETKPDAKERTCKGALAPLPRFARRRGKKTSHGLRTGIAVTAAKDRSVWTPRPPVG
jgi:hypothetical protein